MPSARADSELDDYGPEESELEWLLASTRARLFGRPEGPKTIGRYRVLERIGAGGMGVVYRCHDDALDRHVAVKILREDPAGRANKQSGHERLLREARTMAKLSHPNVVHVYEVGLHDEAVFISMEYIRGDTLTLWSSHEHSPQQTIAMHGQAGRG
ncbi:MAG: protein kinase, partial [Myxococcota bacterium]